MHLALVSINNANLVIIMPIVEHHLSVIKPLVLEIMTVPQILVIMENVLFVIMQLQVDHIYSVITVTVQLIVTVFQEPV